ncbi:uncharacterized protein LOC144428051 [Styela clava]
MEMECYEYGQRENAYEIPQTPSVPPAVPKQDNNEAMNKKTLFVLAISFGICFIVSVAAFILIMQLQNDMKYTKEKLEEMIETDSSLANVFNDTQKQQVKNFEKQETDFKSSLRKISNETQQTFLKTKSELEISIKKELSELNSKIHNGDNKLNKSLSDTNSRITEMFSISGWFRASNNLIYKRFTDPVNYATAKAQCEGMGARLVSTGIRNNQVKNEIFPKYYLTGAFAWIGLDDISNEGIWVWSDRVNESPSAIWESSEPNGGRRENCAVIRLSGVVDTACSEVYKFVCEKNDVFRITK